MLSWGNVCRHPPVCREHTGKSALDEKKMAWGKKKDRPERPVIVAWSGKRDLNPRLQPWQGCTLPLSYSRKGKAGPKAGHYDLERETGFEPATSTLARLHSTTELFPPVEATSGFEPENGGFADLCLTTWLCRLFWSRETGFEPATSTLARLHSTTELFPLTKANHCLPARFPGVKGNLSFSRQLRTVRTPRNFSSNGKTLLLGPFWYTNPL